MNDNFSLKALDFDEDAFDLTFDLDGFENVEALNESALKNDFIIIKRYPRPKMAYYDQAVKMARDIPALNEGEIFYAICSGNFIFGDMIEAFLVERNLLVEELLIATLSLGQENVDSLINLMRGEYVEKMALIVSDYWYSHERRKEGGVPYIKEKLADVYNEKFEFAAAGLHTKVTLIKTADFNFVMHGSANLRSSYNVEQVCIENNKELYDFNRNWMIKILENFNLCHKSIRGNKLWQQIVPGQEKKQD